MPSDPRKVAGCCPMGCGHTLFLGQGGHITCSLTGCPKPSAASTIIGDRETEHIVHLYRKTFIIRHPLRERLDDELMECLLGEYIAALSGPPRVPGTYRVSDVQDGAASWRWVEVPTDG